MSISVKISQLEDGVGVSSVDQLPVARGSTSTVRIPASQFVVGGTNIGAGSGQLFSGTSSGAGTTMQFRTLSGADGLTIGTSGSTLVISASGQNPVKTSITGTSPVPTNGINTTFAINGANSINPNNYRVDIDGVLQEPINDYTIVGSNIVFNPAPPAGSKVTVVSNNLVRAYDIIPSDSSVTSNKLTLDIQYSLVPTGAIMPFYRSTAPDGWLICDGSAIPTQFTTLIALVGATTPNLRGMFIRGWSPGTFTTSRDPLSATRALGNVQDDAFESHTHPYTWTTPEAPAGTYGVGGTGLTRATNNGITSPTGDTETRPVNIALLYCIKT